ncbi:MAG TPA: polysaccharide deacetylase family protein [Longimicrobiales bacterium]|nr:polysaccharide deacetylase family protein [Longimicrobiales bacterium]
MTLAESWRKNWPEVRAAGTGGLPAFVLSPRPAEIGDGVPVFCYHVVDRETFEADLDFLRSNGYTTIDADALLLHITGDAPSPPRSVVLTFDDGAVNLYRVAYPLLRAYGLTATAFIVPRYHDAAGDRGSVRAGGVADTGGTPLDDDLRPCTWAEVREMHSAGVIRFESHTYEHRYVPAWPEPVPMTGIDESWTRVAVGVPGDMRTDFESARSAIEARLGSTVRHLAFPRFDGTPHAVAIGREVGYRGFWWGVQPGVDMNRPGGDPARIVRLNGDLLRRLPGDGRVSLAEVLSRRARGRRGRGRSPGFASGS